MDFNEYVDSLINIVKNLKRMIKKRVKKNEEILKNWLKKEEWVELIIKFILIIKRSVI